MTTLPEIYLTKRDSELLQELLEAVPQTANAELLRDELSRARLIPSRQTLPGVVTMNARVRFVDETTGQEREVTVVLPDEANAGTGKVSVLSPVGTALLGFAEGQTIEWALPNGRKRRFRIRSVGYGPEAVAA